MTWNFQIQYSYLLNRSSASNSQLEISGSAILFTNKRIRRRNIAFLQALSTADLTALDSQRKYALHYNCWIFSFLCSVLPIIVFPVGFIPLSIVLFFLLRFIASDYSFSILKLFFLPRSSPARLPVRHQYTNTTRCRHHYIQYSDTIRLWSMLKCLTFTSQIKSFQNKSCSIIPAITP